MPGWRVRLQTDIKREEFIRWATSYSRLYVLRDEAAWNNGKAGMAWPDAAGLGGTWHG